MSNSTTSANATVAITARLSVKIAGRQFDISVPYFCGRDAVTTEATELSTIAQAGMAALWRAVADNGIITQSELDTLLSALPEDTVQLPDVSVSVADLGVPTKRATAGQVIRPLTLVP